MTKSLSRDVALLASIMKNRQNIIDVFARFGCDFSNTPRGLINDKMAFDLCAMYMAQIGENVKFLTDGTKQAISGVIDVNILRYFRNMIDHSYEKVNKAYLVPYIQLMVSKEVEVALKQRYLYCMQNKKK